MNTYTNEIHESKKLAAANVVTKKQSTSKPTLQLVDNRPEAVTQRKTQATIQLLDKNSKERSLTANSKPKEKNKAQQPADKPLLSINKIIPTQKGRNIPNPQNKVSTTHLPKIGGGKTLANNISSLDKNKIFTTNNINTQNSKKNTSSTTNATTGIKFLRNHSSNKLKERSITSQTSTNKPLVSIPANSKKNVSLSTNKSTGVNFLRNLSSNKTKPRSISTQNNSTQGRLTGQRTNLDLSKVKWPDIEPKQGDLVYGIDAERTNLMLGAQNYMKRIKSKNHSTNTHTLMGKEENAVPFYINPLNDALLTNDKSIKNTQVPTSSGKNMLKKYGNFVTSHKPPKEHEEEEKDVLKYWKEKGKGGTNEEKSDIRRGKFGTLSKLGINFTHKNQKKIHFGLTNFNTQAALDPNNPYYGAVTSQEMRHFYHNKEKLAPETEQDKLKNNTAIFIKEGKIVVPPWEEQKLKHKFEYYNTKVAPDRLKRGSLAQQYPVKDDSDS